MKKTEAEHRITPIRESETAPVQRIFPISIQSLFFHSFSPSQWPGQLITFKSFVLPSFLFQMKIK